MNETLQLLIDKYKRHLANGETNIRNLEQLGLKPSLEYQHQNAINSIWKLILNDLANLTDKYSYDDHKKE